MVATGVLPKLLAQELVRELGATAQPGTQQVPPPLPPVLQHCQCRSHVAGPARQAGGEIEPLRIPRLAQTPHVIQLRAALAERVTLGQRAERPAGPAARQPRQGRRRLLAQLIRLAEPFCQHGHGQRRDVDSTAAGAHCLGKQRRPRRHEHERHCGGRLLERLQERVRGLLGQGIRRIDDDDPALPLVGRRHRHHLQAPDLANADRLGRSRAVIVLADATQAPGPHRLHIGVFRLSNALAGSAFAAGPGIRRPLATVQVLRQQ